MSEMTVERGFATEPAAVLSEKAERERVSGLAAKARQGTHAIFATRLLSVFTTLSSITILARLIPPADFGIWAMAGLALGLMAILCELGLLSSIVQARNLTLQQQDAYFWISVAASSAAAGLLALAAPLLASIYGAPLLRPVLWVCCASLVVNGVGVVHAALLRRRLQYKKLAVIEGGAMLFGLVTGLTGAFLWRNVWALVAAYVAQVLWWSVTALLLCRWVPGRPSRTTAMIDLSFSFQVTLYNVLTYAGNNVSLAAGYRFGAADLGFFNRGQQLCQLAQFAFLSPITEVGFGLLCRLKPDRTYTDAYIALARRVSILFIPFAAVLPIVSGDLTLALLGPAWAPASPILAWFALAIFGQSFASLSAQVMTSQGRGHELRSWAVANLIVRAGGAVVGSQFGIVGMTAGFSLATFFLTLPLMVWAGWSGPVKLRDQLAAMWPGVLLALAATLAAALAVLGADALRLSAGWSRLLFVGGSAALAWAVLCLVLRPARDALLGRGAARE
jgi:PST family polysaccharide transporter